VTGLNAEQSTGKPDVLFVVLGVVLMAAGGMQLLFELRFDTNLVRLVVGALNLIFGVVNRTGLVGGPIQREDGTHGTTQQVLPRIA
jgi:uncharacterized membrane protein HdeD (DUF308 family)